MVFVLALVLAVGCDVRPFSDLHNDDDNGTEANDDETVTAADDDEVSGTNQAPEPIAQDVETFINTAATIRVAPNDPDMDDTHIFTISLPPANGTAEVVEQEAGLVTYTPDLDFAGPDEFEVRVTDDGDPPRSGEVLIDVTVNPRPVP